MVLKSGNDILQSMERCFKVATVSNDGVEEGGTVTNCCLGNLGFEPPGFPKIILDHIGTKGN